MKAEWNGEEIASSDVTLVVEGKQYFPPDDVNMEYLEENNQKHYTCPEKGEAQFYDLVAGGSRLEGAAWSYPDPKEKAGHIAGYVAFGDGVEVGE
jgi:uncharacterized protein (DUF427 family)